MSTRLPPLLAGLLVLGWISLSHAYVQITGDRGEKFRWREKAANVTLRLGCQDTTQIERWGPCWDDVAEHAMDAWNDAGSRFRFSRAAPASAPLSCGSEDGINVVVWGRTVCREPIGIGILALTRTWTDYDGRITDSDIIFNTAFDWAAYTGPWEYHRPDLHRVAIHEFGHMLGLDHPDDHGQFLAAIMNVDADNTETLQEDDIAGARAIYGRDPNYTPPVVGFLENPGHRSFRSGVGVISGWVCEAKRVDVQIGRTRYAMATQTDRPDTLSACGDANNGFVTLFNFNRLGEGTHTARLLVDGKPHGDPIEFKVTTFGEEFMRGASGQYEVAFPDPGDTTVLGWDQNSQNFVVRERR